MISSITISTKHFIPRSIKTKPSKVTVQNAQQVWRTVYGERPSPVEYEFKVGDQVKISEHKHVSYLPNWSEETFTVEQRIPRDPPVYKCDGQLNKGTFYETELTKSSLSKDHLFRVEKFPRRRGKGAQAEGLVPWQGFPTKHDSWVPARQLVSLKWLRTPTIYSFQFQIALPRGITPSY